MSLSKLLSFHFILMLSVFTGADNVYFLYRWARCLYSFHDLSDMVFIDSFYFNKYMHVQFNSTLGRFVGFSEYGMYTADFWNNNTDYIQMERDSVQNYCKYNAQIWSTNIHDKSVTPKVKLSSVKQAGGRHPAVLMCSAYDFYPEHIKVSWLRDGKPVTSDMTSTLEMANGDWYYQIHSELDYTPQSGEKISCMVEHASFKTPMIYDWDPSLPESERNKYAIGAAGLVLGIIIAAAGFIYYKKKSAGRILVPH